MYLKTKRIDSLVELMEDPIFATNNQQDEKYMTQNQKTMFKISNTLNVGVMFVAIFWTMDPIFQRMNDPNSKFYLYVPFETDTWPRFLIANFLDTIVILFWVGVGHINIDCFIATCYAQVRVQLQIINYNLEHLFDDAKKGDNSRFKFHDHSDESVQKRFVFYIKRYERVYWFSNEITSIFNIVLTFQIIVTCLASCLAIFQMSSTDIISTKFALAVGYYIVFNSELYMYCIYGGLIEYESKLTADFLYLGEWLSVSPKFRKQLLIAMTRWTRPITPRIAGMFALSPSTFVSVTKSAYTLFTVMKTTNSINRE